MKVLMYETKSTGCGKITGMFKNKEIYTINDYYIVKYLGNPCVTEEEFLKYKGDKDIFSWLKTVEVRKSFPRFLERGHKKI